MDGAGADVWGQQYQELCKRMLAEFGSFLMSVERMSGATKDAAKLKSIAPYINLFESIKVLQMPARTHALLLAAQVASILPGSYCSQHQRFVA